MNEKPQEPASDTAHGYYRLIERLLHKQISENRNDLELRLRLLEVLFTTAQADEFLREARELHARMDLKQHVHIWQTVVSMARMLGLNDPLFRHDEEEAIAYITEAWIAEDTFNLAANKKQRFGDDAGSRPYFAALAAEWALHRRDPTYLAEMAIELGKVLNRPSPLVHAERLSQHVGGAQIYIKRETLTPPQSRVTICTLGQILLARRLKRSSVVTSTVDGRRGVLVASLAARYGLKAVVYINKTQQEKEADQIFRMRLRGADVIEVDPARLPRHDLREAALDHWRQQSDTCFMVTGLEASPHPYPEMLRDFVSIIGLEVRRQLMQATSRLPDMMVARVGHNADTIGFFDPFLPELNTRLVCVESETENLHRAEMQKLMRHYGYYHERRVTLDSRAMRVADAILEGLEYPSVTRELAWLKACQRTETVKVSAKDARGAILHLSRDEGITPAPETAHSFAWAIEAADRLKPEQSIVVIETEPTYLEALEVRKFLETQD